MLTQWEQEGILSPEAARELRRRHLVPESTGEDGAGFSLGQVLIGSMGALLIGTGLIAILAYNWDTFSAGVRLAIGFLPLLIAQGLCLRLLLRQDQGWKREATTIFLTLAIGVALSVVSQVYHVGGEWSPLLLTWLLLAAPLIWVFRPHSVTLFYLIGITLWTINVTWSDGQGLSGPVMYPFLLLVLAPYWWIRRQEGKTLSTTMRWFLAVSAYLGFMCASAQLVADPGQRGPIVWCLVAACLMLIPLNRTGLAEGLGKKPHIIVGAIHLLITSFYITSSLYVSSYTYEFSFQILTLFLLLIYGVFAALAVRSRRWELLAISGLVLFTLLFDFQATWGLAMWGMLFYLVALGIFLILSGLRAGRGSPRLGATILCLVVIIRMMSSDLPLLVKGIAFIIIGIAFLTFNFYIGKLRRSLNPT